MAHLYDQIVLLGDSITEQAEKQELGFAFAPQVRADYIRRLDVVNRGLSGYNTELALKALDYVLPPVSSSKVRLLTIFFGANDSCFPFHDIPGKNQSVELPVFRKNLIKIVQHPKVVAHQPRIILIAPPPIDERRQRALDASKDYPFRRSAANTKLYAEAVCDAAKVLEVPVLDLWSRFMDHAGWQQGDPLPGSEDIEPNPKLNELFTDGLHLTPKGYRLVYDGFKEVVAAIWPELLPENLPMILPPWDEFPPNWHGPPQ